jgi:hypothetical protein
VLVILRVIAWIRSEQRVFRVRAQRFRVLSDVIDMTVSPRDPSDRIVHSHTHAPMLQFTLTKRRQRGLAHDHFATNVLHDVKRSVQRGS